LIQAGLFLCLKEMTNRHKLYHAGSQKHQENNRFYSGAKWRRARAAQLDREPLCRHCRKSDRLTEATHVDHITPRSKGGAPFDAANLQSLCKPCHEGYKQRLEKSGFISGCTPEGIPIDPNHHWNK
jgi:5-methylcytosine-specific restriction protein A